MDQRAIKHQLTYPLELTSGSFLIGRTGILVIPRIHLVSALFEGFLHLQKSFLRNCQVSDKNNCADFRFYLLTKVSVC